MRTQKHVHLLLYMHLSKSVTTTSMENDNTVTRGKNEALFHTLNQGKHKTINGYIMRYMQIIMH